MTSITVNTIAIAFMVFFGLLAYYPLFLKEEPKTARVPDREDRVIHIAPARGTLLRRESPRHQPIPMGSTPDDDDSSRRPAA